MEQGERHEAVQQYAAAVARLADLFADRAQVLSAMQLDEAGWAALDGSWRSELSRLAAAGNYTLAEVFREGFSRESVRLSERRRGMSAAAEQARRPTATPVGDAAAAGTDGTAIGEVVLEPALPFAGEHATPLAGRPAAGEGSDADPLGATVGIEAEAVLDLTLPFEENP